MNSFFVGYFNNEFRLTAFDRVVIKGLMPTANERPGIGLFDILFHYCCCYPRVSPAERWNYLAWQKIRLRNAKFIRELNYYLAD